MPVPLRTDFDAHALRAIARATKDGPQARRLLALAAIYEGATRTEAARIGGGTVQIVRDWVVKFNAHGPEGLINRKPPGQPSKLTDTHRAALQAIVEQGPIPAIHGVVRWRLIDLIQWVWEEFRITISKQTLSRELRALGYRKLSARPRHHAKNEAAVAAFKKLDRQSWLARLLFQGGQVGIRVAAEAGAQGPGMPPVVKTLAECGPSLPADPTQLAHSGWAQPRRRGRDQAHLPTEHGGRGGRLAPTGPALVVALRAKQMLEVVVGPRQAGYRVTMEQPGFVAAGHLAEVPDGVGERPRLSAVPVHGRDQPVEAAPDKAGVLLAPVFRDGRGRVPPAVGARDVRP